MCYKYYVRFFFFGFTTFRFCRLIHCPSSENRGKSKAKMPPTRQTATSKSVQLLDFANGPIWISRPFLGCPAVGKMPIGSEAPKWIKLTRIKLEAMPFSRPLNCQMFLRPPTPLVPCWPALFYSPRGLKATAYPLGKCWEIFDLSSSS